MTGTTQTTRTISGTLDIGLEYDGVLHRDFVLRLATVGDEIDMADSGVPDAGFSVGMMAVCLESLGTIPPESITYDLLRGMASEDYTQLTQARDALKKKLKPASGNTATSGTPASGSGDTGTPTKTSGR